MSIPSTGLGDSDFLGGKILCSTSDAKRALDCGQTTLYALINAGELETCTLGRNRKIKVSSLLALVDRRLEAARVQKAV